MLAGETAARDDVLMDPSEGVPQYVLNEIAHLQSENERLKKQLRSSGGKGAPQPTQHPL